MRLRFDIFDDDFEMVKEQLITNKKSGEELSLSIINDGYEDEDSMIADCVVEIKRKRIVPKAAKKNAK